MIGFAESCSEGGIEIHVAMAEKKAKQNAIVEAKSASNPTGIFTQSNSLPSGLLLRETKKSVVAVGLDVGYANPSHFAQLFRRGNWPFPKRFRSG